MSDDGLRDDPEVWEPDERCPECDLVECDCEEALYLPGTSGRVNPRRPAPVAMRVQIARGPVLFAEAIVEPHMVDPFSPHNVWARLGGVVIQRADLPRTWDVPVGSLIQSVAPAVARRKAS